MILVFLHGPAACGKLTVAREIAARTGLPVFHNHLAVDAAAAVFPFGSDAFVRLRERYWLSMFEEAAAAGRSLIFTFAPEPSVAPDFPDRVRALIERHGGRVAFVRLTVDAAEQDARIDAASRRAFGKLRSIDLLRQLRPAFTACEATMPHGLIEIDTTSMPPEAAARAIIDGLGLDATS